MCGVQRSGAANIGSWSTPSPPDVTGINGSKTVRLGAHTSLHMGAAVHNSPFIIYTSASPTENYTFANDVFWTRNDKFPGFRLSDGWRASNLLDSVRTQASCDLSYFHKTAAAVLFSCPPSSSFYLHRWFIAHLSLPWSFAWVALSFLVCSFVCPAMIAPDQASIFFLNIYRHKSPFH